MSFQKFLTENSKRVQIELGSSGLAEKVCDGMSIAGLSADNGAGSTEKFYGRSGVYWVFVNDTRLEQIVLVMKRVAKYSKEKTYFALHPSWEAKQQVFNALDQVYGGDTAKELAGWQAKYK